MKDKFEKIPLGISEILPGFLYLGSSRDSRDLNQLRNYKIKHILNCAKEWKNMNQEIFNFHNTELMDVEEQNLLDALENSFSFIGELNSHFPHS